MNAQAMCLAVPGTNIDHVEHPFHDFMPVSELPISGTINRLLIMTGFFQMRFSLVLGALLLVFAGSVLSKSSEVIKLDVTKGGFHSQQDSILKAINTDVDYSEISSTDRVSVNQSLSGIAEVLKDGKTYASVSGEEQQKIIAAQNEINSALVQAKKDSRMVCKREMVLGSKLDKKVCRTAASMKRENDLVRDASASGTSKIK